MPCTSVLFSKVCRIHKIYIQQGSKNYNGELCFCLWWKDNQSELDEIVKKKIEEKKKTRKRVLIIGQSFSTIRVEGTPAFSNDYSGNRLRRWFDFEDLEVFNRALEEGYYLTTNLVLKQKDLITYDEVDRNRIRQTIIDFRPNIVVLIGYMAKNYILKEFKIPNWTYLPHPSTKNRLVEGKDEEIIAKLSELGIRYSQNKGD